MLFEKKMMMEAVNGEQDTFRRMDEILENVTHALELPLRQAESVVAEACRQWAISKSWSHKSYVYSTTFKDVRPNGQGAIAHRAKST